MRNELLQITDVARLANVSPSSVRRWTRTGALPVVKLGRSVRVRWTDFDEFVKARVSRGGR